MENDSDFDAVGIFDTRFKAFLEAARQLRPQLHRYCARMAGSVMDGEDIMQEVLFEAYRKLGQFDDDRPMGPWLFRIAHNRCIDFLRRNQIRRRAEHFAAIPDIAHPPEPVGREMDRALERLVMNLPPKERACVLLKDVFDYSLEDIAGLVDSTVGGVKSALSRGRSKLASADLPPEVRELAGFRADKTAGALCRAVQSPRLVPTARPDHRRCALAHHQLLRRQALRLCTSSPISNGCRHLGDLHWEGWMESQLQWSCTRWTAPGTRMRQLASTRAGARSCACATMSNAPGFLPPPAAGISTHLLHERLLRSSMSRSAAGVGLSRVRRCR